MDEIDESEVTYISVNSLYHGEAMFAKEAAEYLGIGVSEMREWMKNPAFPSAKIGENGYVIFKTTLKNWVADPKNIIEFKRALEEKRRKA